MGPSSYLTPISCLSHCRAAPLALPTLSRDDVLPAHTAIRQLGFEAQLLQLSAVSLSHMNSQLFHQLSTGYSACHQRDFLSQLVSCLGPLQDFQHPAHSPLAAPPHISPISEQVMVIVAADGPTPTTPRPVHAGGVDGAAVDHRAGHPGWRRTGHSGSGIPTPPPPYSLAYTTPWGLWATGELLAPVCGPQAQPSPLYQRPPP